MSRTYHKALEWHIKVNGKRVASFLEGDDRDICLEALKEYWGEAEDQIFEIENPE